jgi:16S rRNA (adenine1518-N6/adenine1519-N6)-dimethyltransferase
MAEVVTFPRTARALRDVLEAEDLRPKRKRGQNFLSDPQAVDAIVRDAGVGPDDRVIEVGTGPGLLTHALAATGAEVVGFEVDGRMLALARGLTDWPDRVTFVEGDVLARKHELAEPFQAALETRPSASGGRVLLVSNLPYGAGTPILLGVLGLERPPDDVVVTLQQEVVSKLLARAGDRAYGATSVVAGLCAEGELLRRFGPEVFWPRPKVRSAVARLTPRAERLVAHEEHRPFGAFVTGLFSHRRKMLPSALRKRPGGGDADAERAALEAAGIPATARVEEVEAERLLALWRRLS